MRLFFGSFAALFGGLVFGLLVGLVDARSEGRPSDFIVLGQDYARCGGIWAVRGVNE